MTIVDVRKLTRADIYKLGSNTTALVDSDRRRIRIRHEPDAAPTTGQTPADSAIPKQEEAIAC